jgi:hypothetical protein
MARAGKAKPNIWLLLEKGDHTRVSQGIDRYEDLTGKVYQYDSLVPNHTNLDVGDIAIIRKESVILGWGMIGSIKKSTKLKKHRRCPFCHSTDIRERITKAPRWKCGKCAKEFKTAIETNARVISYLASIANFVPIPQPPSVRSVKMCAYGSKDGIKSQLSMLLLDPLRIRKILGGVFAPLKSPTA